jgi:deoxyadenosine/deoxycytidine kinase
MGIKSVIGVGGEPATGKTTLFRRLIELYDVRRTFHYQVFRGMMSEKSKMIVAGIYDDSLFGGTDKLSMAVQPVFFNFLKMINKNQCYDGYTVLFEGDRLFNAKCIRELMEKYVSHFILLQANDTTLADRHTQRNDTQSDKFLKGRKTKYNNIISEFPDDIQLMSNNTELEQELVFSRVCQWVDGTHK